MPVVTSGYVFRTIVIFLKLLGALKLRDRLFCAACPPQVVAMHVMRMRNGWRHAHVNLTLSERVLAAADGFIAVREIVMRCKLVRRKSERRFVKCDGIRPAVLSVRVGRAFLGESALNPQPRVVRTYRDCGGYSGSVREILLQIGIVKPGEKKAVNLDLGALDFVNRISQRLRLVEHCVG